MSEAERIAELADRVEAMGGPGREVDRDIMLLAVPCDRAPFRYWAPMNENTGYGVVEVESVYYAPHCAQTAPVPEFTSSLDAAMTLIPKGWSWSIGQADGFRATADMWIDGQAVHVRKVAATPALALCAAALRARNVLLSSLKGEGNG